MIKNIALATLLTACVSSAAWADNSYDLSTFGSTGFGGSLPGASGIVPSVPGILGTAGAAGTAGNTTLPTNAFPFGRNFAPTLTGHNNACGMTTQTAPLAPIYGPTTNGLPPTTMDSFVQQAAENAEFIYGDEGTMTIPPYMGFDVSHRINSGILADSATLTTGHHEVLPDAWGRDEFLIGGPEFSLSGTYSNNILFQVMDGVEDFGTTGQIPVPAGPLSGSP
jgi:hypothetical protein